MKPLELPKIVNTFKMGIPGVCSPASLPNWSSPVFTLLSGWGGFRYRSIFGIIYTTLIINWKMPIIWIITLPHLETITVRVNVKYISSPQVLTVQKSHSLVE
jgi:hypothetical protein